MLRTVSLYCAALAALLETGDSAATSVANPNEAPPKSGDARWLHYLETVSGWIMQRHLATDNLTHCRLLPPPHAIFSPHESTSTQLAQARQKPLAGTFHSRLLVSHRLPAPQLQTGHRGSYKRQSSSTETLLGSCLQPLASHTTAHTLMRRCVGATSCASSRPRPRHLRGTMVAIGQHSPELATDMHCSDSAR